MSNVPPNATLQRKIEVSERRVGEKVLKIFQAKKNLGLNEV